MKTNINIKNFRVFDDKGASFDINPLTILTGSNSSGKSSAVKAIFLLNSFLAQIKKAVVNGETIELDKYKLDFTKYPNNLLGRFDKVVNRNSNNKSISIGFSIHSLMLSKEVYVNLVFSADENDVLNNAFLESFEMSTDEGLFYSSRKSNPSFCNLNILKEEFVTFLQAEFAIHSYCGIESTYEFEGGMTEAEYKSKVEKIIEYLRTVEETRRYDILHYVRFSQSKGAIVNNPDYCSFLEDTKNNNSLFYIPVLNELSKIQKNKIQEFISTRCLVEASEGLQAATQKVLNAFNNSGFDSFDLFFHDWEQTFLEHVECKGEFFNTNKKKIGMLSPKALAIKVDYLPLNPYDSKILEIGFGDEDSRLSEPKEDKETLKLKKIKEWEERELTFDMLYEIVMEWNRAYDKALNDVANNTDNSEKEYVYEEPSIWNPIGSVYHIVYELITKFAAAIVTEALTPEWGGNMSYVSSSRASVNRLYTLEGNDDFSMLLQNYFEKKRLFLANKNSIGYNKEYVPDSFMNKWIGKFDIGNSISLDIDKEGLGVQIRLHKTSKDEGRLLADEGYGITQLVSILLQIETAILSAQGKKTNNYWGLSHLDNYDMEKFHYEVNTISIEEPEIHLHPKYQSILADMLVDACQEYNIHFVIETHSEYLIRKLQLLVSGHVNGVNVDRSMVSIYYINSADDKSKQKVKKIEICSDGYLDDSFGEGFYDEATRLSRQLM